MISSFIFILASEIGDKTFILTILYSSKYNPIIVFIVASVALIGIHCLSCFIGSLAHFILSRFVLSIITVVAFFIFGISMLYQAYSKEEEEDFDKEYKEIHEAMLEKDDNLADSVAEHYIKLQDEEN